MRERRSGGSASSRVVGLDERLAEEQRDRAGDRQIWTKRKRNRVVTTLEYDERDADGRAHDRRQEDDDRQDLPAEPGTERGQQLEVAVTHALLAADQLEEPVDRPQRQVTGDRADDGIMERGER